MKGLGAALAAIASVVVWGSAGAATLVCPGEPDVKAGITKYITVEYWTPAHRETWKVKNVSGFQFGPVKTGRIIVRQVDYGPAQEVCPVRVEYSFQVEYQTGRRETTQMGADKTHLFYKDGFDEWAFKIE